MSGRLGGYREGAGRKPHELDLKAIEALAGIGGTLEEISAVFSHSLSGIKKRKDIMAAVQRGREQGKATLRRMQWEAAKEGNAAILIWLGKQMLGQKDKHEIGGLDGAPVSIEVHFVDHRPKMIDVTPSHD